MNRPVFASRPRGKVLDLDFLRGIRTLLHIGEESRLFMPMLSAHEELSQVSPIATLSPHRGDRSSLNQDGSQLVCSIARLVEIGLGASEFAHLAT